VTAPFTTNAASRDIVALARTWLGTPYHHQMSAKGLGCDCLGLVRGVWRQRYGVEPEASPAYSRDWAEASGEETLLDAARRHFVEIDPASAQPGDVLVFRYRPRSAAKHLGILSGLDTLIHACEGAPACEIALTPWWRRRIAAAFRYPDPVDRLRNLRV
jgi:NlpC/P60 family putative phage cell wall peptidase